MASEATCPTCRRDVGLMNPRAMPGDRPREPRLISHTVGGRGAPAPNPRCAASGLPIDPAAVRAVARRPSQRGSHNGRTRTVA
jgi:hypothetical protein